MILFVSKKRRLQEEEKKRKSEEYKKREKQAYADFEEYKRNAVFKYDVGFSTPFFVIKSARCSYWNHLSIPPCKFHKVYGVIMFSDLEYTEIKEEELDLVLKGINNQK